MKPSKLALTATLITAITLWLAFASGTTKDGVNFAINIAPQKTRAKYINLIIKINSNNSFAIQNILEATHKNIDNINKEDLDAKEISKYINFSKHQEPIPQLALRILVISGKSNYIRKAIQPFASKIESDTININIIHICESTSPKDKNSCLGL